MTETVVAVPLAELLELKNMLEQAQLAVQTTLAGVRWAEAPQHDEAAQKFAAYRQRVRAREGGAETEQEEL